MKSVGMPSTNSVILNDLKVDDQSAEVTASKETFIGKQLGSVTNTIVTSTARQGTYVPPTFKSPKRLMEKSATCLAQPPNKLPRSDLDSKPDTFPGAVTAVRSRTANEIIQERFNTDANQARAYFNQYHFEEKNTFSTMDFAMHVEQWGEVPHWADRLKNRDNELTGKYPDLRLQCDNPFAERIAHNKKATVTKSCLLHQRKLQIILLKV